MTKDALPWSRSSARRRLRQRLEGPLAAAAAASRRLWARQASSPAPSAMNGLAAPPIRSGCLPRSSTAAGPARSTMERQNAAASSGRKPALSSGEASGAL